MSTHKQKLKKSLLSRLRAAVNKVRLLLSSTILSRTWHAATVIRRAASLSKRHLSFNDRPGLMLCSEETCSSEGSDSSNSRELQRTISCPSDDDIDKRAETFIANFRRQLRMERQISLQLRYCREPSFELISPWTWLLNFWFLDVCLSMDDFVFFGERSPLWPTRREVVVGFSLKALQFALMAKITV